MRKIIFFRCGWDLSETTNRIPESAIRAIRQAR